MNMSLNRRNISIAAILKLTMLPSKGLRWSGYAINTGKRRLNQQLSVTRGVRATQ